MSSRDGENGFNKLINNNMENIIIDGIEYAPVKIKEQKLSEKINRQKYIDNGLCPICGENLIVKIISDSDDFHDYGDDTFIYCSKNKSHFNVEL